MKHFLKKALGFSGPQQSTIRADLARLDEKKKGLGAQAAAFVISGEGETVLSTLTTVAPAEKLLVCRSYYAFDDKITPERGRLFLDMSPYDVPMLARYARVLTAAAGGAPDNAAGSKHAPDALRVLMSEAFNASQASNHSWPRKARSSAPKGLTVDMLGKISEALDGSLVDVFDILFWDSATYGTIQGQFYRDIVDLRAMARANAPALIEGANRLTAHGRETLINWLVKNELAAVDPFFDFVIDQVGASAKGVRTAALDALHQCPKKKVLAAAKPRLEKGNVAMREGMVRMLAIFEDDAAIAMLEAQKAGEKTARVPVRHRQRLGDHGDCGHRSRKCR